MSADRPLVTLGWDLWCPRHLEPLRANWPGACALAMLTLFQEAAAMPAVVAEAGADANRLTEALQRFKPICCFIGWEALDRVYAAAGVAR